MPSASGVYSLPPGYLAATGTTIQVSQHNPIFEDVAAALTGRVSRDGTAPMTGALQLAAGTVTAPGAVFSTDPSSGFYKTTAGIGVAIGGQKVAEFVAGGVNGARFLGELIPYTCTVAPALTVLPFGQTLSRTTYAALWVQAQIEITNGNTFYNNGDGSTTFGIGDTRGRAFAAVDNMGGSDSARLAGGSLASVRFSIGGTGGVSAHALTLNETPTGINSSGAGSASVSVTAGGGRGNILVTDGAVGTNQAAPQSGPQYPTTTGSWGSVTSLSGTGSVSVNVTSNNTGGAVHDNMQPTLLGNWLLFAGA